MQAHTLMVQQQQQLGALPRTTAGQLQQACSRASVLPLPGDAAAATSLMLPPQPLLEVAAAATEDEDEASEQR
jgi:hypothetical protein